jgi:biopolymer transport protein ExbB
MNKTTGTTTTPLTTTTTHPLMNQPLDNHRWKTTSLTLFACLLSCATAMAADAGAGAGGEQDTMFSLIKKGGAVMIPLGIASVIALAIGLERFISLRRERILPDDFLEGLGQAWKDDPSGRKAEQYCDESEGAAGHVFKAGIQWQDAGYQAVGKAIEDAGAREADKMKHSLRGLSVIASVSPLLGLLGTVYGMIDAFQRTSSSGGAAKTADLATGIYEALVTTAAGLTIAIPVMLLYQFLSARVDGLIDHIDEVGTEFIATHARRISPGQSEQAPPSEGDLQPPAQA